MKKYYLTSHLAFRQDAKFLENAEQHVAGLRAKYGWLYDRLNEILNRADITANHLVMGFGYEYSTQDILPKLSQAKSEDEVERILNAEFVPWLTRNGELLNQQDRTRIGWASGEAWKALSKWRREKSQSESYTRAGTLLQEHRT